MSQTISQLWNGNIAPCEHCGAHDVEANRLFSLMERNRERLLEGFTAAQREVFQEYVDSSEVYLLRMMELAFREGFCLGSHLAVETMM